VRDCGPCFGSSLVVRGAVVSGLPAKMVWPFFLSSRGRQWVRFAGFVLGQVPCRGDSSLSVLGLPAKRGLGLSCRQCTACVGPGSLQGGHSSLPWPCVGPGPFFLSSRGRGSARRIAKGGRQEAQFAAFGFFFFVLGQVPCSSPSVGPGPLFWSWCWARSLVLVHPFLSPSLCVWWGVSSVVCGHVSRPVVCCVYLSPSCCLV